ncbi:hypothetical protein [Frigidibacter sp. MR17.24]|uniref:hypothetical protein n=1 Tax=Frigidibacter sp. MR17.24 TaxID=3127345 RepID=UPI003012CE98
MPAPTVPIIENLPSTADPATFPSRADGVWPQLNAVAASMNDLAAYWNAFEYGLIAPAPEIIDVTGGSEYKFAVPAGATRGELLTDYFKPDTNNGFLAMQLGINGPSGAFISTSTYFTQSILTQSGGAVSGSDGSSTYFPLTTPCGTAYAGGSGSMTVKSLRAGGLVTIDLIRRGVTSTAVNEVSIGAGHVSVASPANAIRVFVSGAATATFRGTMIWHA